MYNKNIQIRKFRSVDDISRGRTSIACVLVCLFVSFVLCLSEDKPDRFITAYSKSWQFDSYEKAHRSMISNVHALTRLKTSTLLPFSERVRMFL